MLFAETIGQAGDNQSNNADQKQGSNRSSVMAEKLIFCNAF